MTPDTERAASAFTTRALDSLVQEALSTTTRAITESMSQLQNQIAPSMRTSAKTSDLPNLEEQLFDARAAAKQLIASVAMHIAGDDRARLFRQLDSMHDVEEWDRRDLPLTLDSFSSFLRTLLELAPVKYPSLGLTHDGHLLAAWGIEGDRLIVEFLPKRKARWSLNRPTDAGAERAAGESGISRLAQVLAPYDPNHWFFP